MIFKKKSCCCCDVVVVLLWCCCDAVVMLLWCQLLNWVKGGTYGPPYNANDFLPSNAAPCKVPPGAAALPRPLPAATVDANSVGAPVRACVS